MHTPITAAQREQLIAEKVLPNVREELGESVHHNHERDGYRGLDFDLNDPALRVFYETVPPERTFQEGFDLRNEVDMLTAANYLCRRSTDDRYPAMADVRVDKNGEPRFTVRFEGVKYAPLDPPDYSYDREIPQSEVYSIIQLSKTHSAVPLHPKFREPTRFNVFYGELHPMETYECQVLPERFPETDIHLQHFFCEYFAGERFNFISLSSKFRLLIYSPDLHEHLKHLDVVFEKLNQLQYPFRLAESEFFVSEICWS